MKCAWIKIDTNRLTLRLWRTHGKWLDAWELRQWLNKSGYEWVGGHWYACTNGTGHLVEKDEILQVQQRLTEDGITYVDNKPPEPDPGGTR
jgi:hypothetical protein